jgi:hypothetical protein
MQRFSYADVLFIMATLMAMMGSFGMLRSPYRQMLSPWGVWASPVQATEDEKRVQIIEEMMQQTSFSLRLLALGVITLVLSAALTYIL